MRCTELSLNNRQAADGERDLQRAHQLISEARWEEAEQLLRAVLEARVESLMAETLLALGRVRLSQGDQMQAGIQYASAAQMSESPDAYVLAARTALEVTGEYRARGRRYARYWYSEAIRLLRDHEQWERAEAVEAEMARCNVEDTPT